MTNDPKSEQPEPDTITLRREDLPWLADKVRAIHGEREHERIQAAIIAAGVEVQEPKKQCDPVVAHCPGCGGYDLRAANVSLRGPGFSDGPGFEAFQQIGCMDCGQSLGVACTADGRPLAWHRDASAPLPDSAGTAKEHAGRPHSWMFLQYGKADECFYRCGCGESLMLSDPIDYFIEVAQVRLTTGTVGLATWPEDAVLQEIGLDATTARRIRLLVESRTGWEPRRNPGPPIPAASNEPVRYAGCDRSAVDVSANLGLDSTEADHEAPKCGRCRERDSLPPDFIWCEPCGNAVVRRRLGHD